MRDGVHLDGPVGLAARRLAIIDIAHGDQPMLADDGDICVVQNGEILNHLELRAELERDGVRFRTGCDTEVLPHLYLRDGPEFVSRLRGMFAIALWDRRRRRLLLARDRFGIKPLYYARRDGRISFASELKALLRQPDFSREVDPEALHSFLAFNSIPAPLTIFRAARKLAPGHLLLCDRDQAEPRADRYARPAPAPVPDLRREPRRGPGRGAARAAARVGQGAFAGRRPGGRTAVGRSRLVGADRAGLGGLLAAGFDVLDRFRERSFNELDLARQVARRYGTDHHELVVSPRIAELLPKLVAAFDEPFADSSAVPTYLVSELAAAHVKVVLSGEGGDELFGGYETYAADLLALRIGPAAARMAPAGGAAA